MTIEDLVCRHNSVAYLGVYNEEDPNHALYLVNCLKCKSTVTYRDHMNIEVFQEKFKKDFDKYGKLPRVYVPKDFLGC